MYASHRPSGDQSTRPVSTPAGGSVTCRRPVPFGFTVKRAILNVELSGRKETRWNAILPFSPGAVAEAGPELTSTNTAATSAAAKAMGAFMASPRLRRDKARSRLAARAARELRFSDQLCGVKEPWRATLARPSAVSPRVFRLIWLPFLGLSRRWTPPHRRVFQMTLVFASSDQAGPADQNLACPLEHAPTDGSPGRFPASTGTAI
jgi:hypothetical protein